MSFIVREGTGNEAGVSPMWCSSEIIKKVVPVCCLFAVVLTVGLGYYARSPKHLFFPDAMEYAAVARNMARGQGATSQALWVLRLAFTNELPASEVRRPLLLPLWTSLWFRLSAATDCVAIAASGFWWYAAVLLTFLLAWKKGSAEIAAWSVLFLVFDGSFLRYSFCGLSEPLFAFLLIPVFWLLCNSQRPMHFLGVGLLIGLGQWIRTNSLFLLLPALVFVVAKAREKTLLRILCLVVGFGVAVVPIAVRNFSVMGTFALNPLYPYVALNSTPLIPSAHGMERSIEPISPMAYFLSNPAAFFSKWGTHFVNNYQCLAFSIYPLCLGVLIVGCLCLREAQGRKACLFVLLSVVVSLILLSLGEYEDIRFYVPFAPLIFVLAVQVIWEIGNNVGAKPWKTRALLGSLLTVGLIISVNHFSSVDENEGRNWYLERLAARVQTSVPADGVVVSDVPWVTGWRADRISVWLPAKVQELKSIEQDLPVAAVLLTQGALDPREFSPEWGAIHRGESSLNGYMRTTWDDVPGVVLLRKME